MTFAYIAERADNGVTAGVIPVSPVKYSIISAFTAVAWFNVIELNMKVFMTFKRHRGLYFWSMLICSWGIVLHALAFVLKFFVPTANWVMYVIFITVGWYAMVTGQSIVLYSRLHLVVNSIKVLRFVLILICVDVVILHVPTTVFTCGANSPAGHSWINKFNVMERIQMTGFCIQEFVISCIYIWATVKLLNGVSHKRMRKTMTQLLAINVVIIAMDIVLLVTEYSGYYDIEASLKSMVYSVKLKLEFAILNQVMMLAKQGLSEGIMSAQLDLEQTHSRDSSVATIDHANAACDTGFRGTDTHNAAFIGADARPNWQRRKCSVPTFDRRSMRKFITQSRYRRSSDDFEAVPNFITVPEAVFDEKDSLGSRAPIVRGRESNESQPNSLSSDEKATSRSIDHCPTKI